MHPQGTNFMQHFPYGLQLTFQATACSGNRVRSPRSLRHPEAQLIASTANHLPASQVTLEATRHDLTLSPGFKRQWFPNCGTRTTSGKRVGTPSVFFHKNCMHSFCFLLLGSIILAFVRTLSGGFYQCQLWFSSPFCTCHFCIKYSKLLIEWCLV